MKKGRNLMVVAMVLLLTMGMVFAEGSAEAQASKPAVEYLTFGGSDIGGLWFTEAATLTTQWNADIPGIVWTVDTRGGGTANAFWLATGKVAAALNNTPGIRAAMEGEGYFEEHGKQDFSNARVFAALHRSYMTAVVKSDSSIKSFEDLRGKRIAVGQPGNSIQTVLPMICDVMGWDYENDFKKEYIADYDAFDALRTGQIDAVVEWIGLGAGAFEEEFENGGIRLLAMKEDTISKLSAKYPFYVGGTIAQGAYKGQAETSVPFTQDFLTVQASMSDDVVYQMCKVLYDRLNDGTLISTHRAFNEAGFPAYIEKISLLELHDGAKKFYDEIGVVLD